MSRESQYEVTLRINGTDFGVWDKLSGGEVDSEETKFRPGGQGAQVSLGGSKSTGNVTVSRLYRQDRDALNVKQLFAACGSGDCVVTKQLLTNEGDAVADPIVYRGTLKTCTPPDHDSESDSAAMIELVISTAGMPA